MQGKDLDLMDVQSSLNLPSTPPPSFKFFFFFESYFTTWLFQGLNLWLTVLR